MEIKLTKQEQKYKLIVTPELEFKIRTLCSNIYNVEWSGILYYNIEGSFQDNNLVIVAKDVLLMDIGSSAYTEFNMSPDAAVNLVEHPELQDGYMGLIHSHNNMATFFSGTDTATLKEEGAEQNHFVSLIVNNAGVYTAAITQKVHVKANVVSDISYDTFGSVTIPFQQQTRQIEFDEINYYMLDIEMPNTELNERISQIKKEKQKQVEINNVKSLPTFNQYKGYNNNSVANQTTINFDYPYTYNIQNARQEFQKEEKVIKKEVKEKEKSKILDYPLEVNDYKILKGFLCQLLTFNLFILDDPSFDENASVNEIVEGMSSNYDNYFGHIPDEKVLEFLEIYVEMLFGIMTQYGFTLEEITTYFYDNLKNNTNPYVQLLVEVLDLYMS